MTGFSCFVLGLRLTARRYRYSFVSLFPARAVAAACLYSVLQDQGLRISNDTAAWLDEVTNGRVDKDDLDEVLAELVGQS